MSFEYDLLGVTRGTHLRRSPNATARRRVVVVRLLAILALALATAGAGSIASAQAPITPKQIDDYLSSGNLNAPGTPLDSVHQLVFRGDISVDTVQPNILAPHPGPAEVTGCNGVPEGHTIWFDFYPDYNGVVDVATSAAFDTVMAIMPYDPKTALPNTSKRACIVNRTTNQQSLLVNVQAGKSYTMQIGGVGTEAGPLEMLFNYVVPPIRADATLAANPLSSGVRVVSLQVMAPKKTHVTVECTRGCRNQSATGRGGNVTIPGLAGSVLPAGALVKIFVTERNRIGAYVVYKIERGNLTKLPKQCLVPGTKKVFTCPSS